MFISLLIFTNRLFVIMSFYNDVNANSSFFAISGTLFTLKVQPKKLDWVTLKIQLKKAFSLKFSITVGKPKI